MKQTFEYVHVYVRLNKGEINIFDSDEGIQCIHWGDRTCHEYGGDDYYHIGESKSIEEAKTIVNDFLNWFDVGIDRFRLNCESVIRL